MNDLPAMPAPRNTFAALRQFAKPRTVVREQCELCSAELPPEHPHLLELATRQLHCACDACALLFNGSANGRYRQIPKRIEFWPDLILSDTQWEALGIPIALAFFFQSSTQNRIVAMYPSPGGATEATVPHEVWQMLCQGNPCLGELETDVEALLVNRLRGNRHYVRVPIDQCFRLVGLIRMHWRGLSGGTRVWPEIDGFFQQLQTRSVGAASHA